MSWPGFWLAAGLSAAFSMVACDRGAPSAAADHAAASGSPEPSALADAKDPPRLLSPSAEVVAGAGIKTAPVSRRALAGALSLPGELVADPDRMARISSPATGRIERVMFQEGGTVKKGDPLLIVRVPEVARVKSAQAVAQAKASAARANAVRLRLLQAEGLTAEQPVLDAEAEAGAFEAEARSRSDELGALGAASANAFSITLRAPISGSVVSRNAVVGQPAAADQMLATIADLSELWFLARVFEKDLGKLRTGATADVHLNAYPGEHFEGRVEYIGQQVDPVARTLNARIRLKNRDQLLRIGLFGTGLVSMDREQAAPTTLVVPESSVTEIGRQSVVFVARGPLEFELREVTLGDEALGSVEVLAGLRDGEQVVSAGVFNLKSLVLKASFAEDE